MYQKEEYDYLFHLMKKRIPTNKILFMIVSIIKLYPLFFLVHSGGYLDQPDPLSTFHNYFSYFSVTYYLQNSLTAKNMLIIIAIISFLNILLIALLLVYLIRIKQQRRDNYAHHSSFGTLFNIFSNLAFFKYIILFQFFFEIDCLPLICIPKAIDATKLRVNAIYSNIDSFLLTQSELCTGSKLYLFVLLEGFNVIIDILFYWLITSRFFDFNILSNYKWNFYPNLLFSFEFMENCTQAFFIIFLNYHPTTYKILLNAYVALIFFINFFQYLNQNTFCTAYSYIYVFVSDNIRLMCYISAIINTVFYFGFNAVPNDINMIGMLVFEFILVYIIMRLVYSKEKELVKNFLVSSLNELNDKNIYVTLIVLFKEFKVFSDVNRKFSDKSLDIFLENYVKHLKCCEDRQCPCKNYVKKITGASNTIKSGYTTAINFTHVKKDQQEEYILNKFFNVLSSNNTASLKQTNNVNINNIKDNQRQKLIYQLRIKLIRAAKSLITYRLEKLNRDIDGLLSNHFSNKAKDFIHINYFALNIHSNKAYYKTLFLYQEYLSNVFKRRGTVYQSNMIYYLYLKMFSVKEYNDNIGVFKQGRKERSHLHLDFKTLLSLCEKYYEIEDLLISTAISYQAFITYYSKDKLIFVEMLKYVRSVQESYKGLTSYISYNFKNDKINNLFVCTKIILFYKVLHFDIPESLHNKLIIQSHENEQLEKSNSAESNFYLILSYSHGEFIIKFISHELLLVLEYSEDELKGREFDILLPSKLRKLHKDAVISEIKYPENSASTKEVFLISKSNVSLLVDLQYKFLLNLNGEITLLSVIRLTKPTKEFRTAFICIDDHGEVLALNKEFEEYLILSMKMFDFIKIDTEKLILQNNGQRMRNYFKDEENTTFQENFDYELYLMSLFDEEFDIYKEKDERDYNRKRARWELLNETNKKGRYYTRYLELNIRKRIIHKEAIYFIKYNVKLTISLKSVEPHSTTLSLIHAVKISKREMAKLSFYRGEQLYECKTIKSTNEEKANESQDDLFESQSQISSAVTQLKERNSVRLFHQKGNFQRFSSKKKNLLWLMIGIGIFGSFSVFTNMITMICKVSLHQSLYDYYLLRFDTLLLKRGIMTLSSALVSKSLYEELKLNETNRTDAYLTLLNDLLSKESKLVNDVSYNMSVKNSRFFLKSIDTALTKERPINYIFITGQIYSKTEKLFQEIIDINAYCQDALNDNYTTDNPSNTIALFKNYYFNDRIKDLQSGLDTAGLTLKEEGMTVYLIINNIFEVLNEFMDSIITTYDELFTSKRALTLRSFIIIKVIEFGLICIVIGIEWLFVYFGYDKAKKKMVSLRHKIEKNDIETTLNKIIQFINFSNAFDINSLYYIADLDLRKIEESTKTLEVLHTTSVVSPMTLPSGSSKVLSPSQKIQMMNNITNEKDVNDSSKPKSRTIDLNKNEREMMIGANYIQSSRAISKETVDNSFINNANDSSKDGKKNLQKVINRLDQIKGMKVKRIEKRESEKSSRNNQAINESHSESSFRDANNNFDNRMILSYGNNSNIVHESIKQIKSVLKNSNKTLKVSYGKDNNSSLNNNEINNDESKTQMIKQNEEGVSLIKKNTRTTKVQFKEKNVRYYSPVQNVNEANETNPNIHKMPKDQRERPIDEQIPNEECSEDKDDNKQQSLLNAIQDNNPTIQTTFKDSRSKYSSSNANNGSPGKANSSLVEFKDNGKGLSKYNLIDQGKAVTVKKIIDSSDNKMLSKEEIEKQIEKIVYKNKYAMTILNLSLFLFISVYLISVMLNYEYYLLMGNASLYSQLLLNKTHLYRMLMFKYQISLIRGRYDQSIMDIVLQTEENKKELADFESSKYVSVFPSVETIEEFYHLNDSCVLFADNYSKEFNLSQSTEYSLCMTIGGQMNVNGFENAEIYLLSTLIMFINDWKNKMNEVSTVDNEVIISKLTSGEYYNIIAEMDGLLRKNQLVVISFIMKDVEGIIAKVLSNERIVGYLSIGLDVVFLFVSMLLIVYPIKSVEKLITWLINQLVLN